jgi:hypothetical protein
MACHCRFFLRSRIPDPLAQLDIIDLRIQKSLIFIAPVRGARDRRYGRFEAGERSIRLSKIIDLETDMIDAYFGENQFSFDDHSGAATMANLGRLFFSGATLANLQTIQIKITIADVIRMGTVLHGIPNFFPAKNDSIEPGQSPVILCAHSHVRYSTHD